MTLLQQLASAFPDGGVPQLDGLVVFDGIDQPAKEDAVRMFGAKTRAEIAALVGKGLSGIEGLWGIEDLEVLESAGLQYYVEPFLRFLITEEYEDPEDFSFFLMYHLSEIVRRRGPEIFTGAQRQFLIELARQLAGQILGSNDWRTSQRGHCKSLIERLRA